MSPFLCCQFRRTYGHLEQGLVESTSNSAERTVNQVLGPSLENSLPNGDADQKYCSNKVHWASPITQRDRYQKYTANSQGSSIRGVSIVQSLEANSELVVKDLPEGLTGAETVDTERETLDVFARQSRRERRRWHEN